MSGIGLDSAARDWETLRKSFRWQVPARYNLARACCTRWARDRSRFALYDEDESGRTEAWTFWDVQQAANRLSNVLGAMGVMAGERVALILPQRAETAIAHIACYQMGVIAVPVSPTIDATALEYRLARVEASVAVVDADGLPRLGATRAALPLLKHVIGVGAARESWVRPWASLLPLASSRYVARDTAADDPALIMHTDAGDGSPNAVLLAQRTLLGTLPGFVCAHDFYPQAGDLFWSPADWSSTDGLFGALLPCWAFGQPLLACRSGFDPAKALWLMEKYAVRNVLLRPRELYALLEAEPRPRESHDLVVRSLVSIGQGAELRQRTFEALGVTLNQIHGLAEINAIIGDSATVTSPTPGAMGRAFPGHHVALLDAAGQPVAPGEAGEICVRRSCDGLLDPAFMLGYWRDPKASAERFFGGGIDDPLAWYRTGDLARADESDIFRDAAPAPAGLCRDYSGGMT